ncbi:MAG: CCC motif membrane protein [Bacteroidota bacterium]
MEDNMNQFQPQQPMNPYNPNVGEQLPNSTGVLVLGILSILFCVFYGVIGLILGIVALSLAGKGNAAYQAEPQRYNLQSWNTLKAGRVCAIIGTVLSGLYLLFVILFIAFWGALLTNAPWDHLGR